MNNQLLSFIAHLKSPRAEHYIFRDEMTARGFPCVVSNDISNPGAEYPELNTIHSKTVSEDRLNTLFDPANHFLFYFLNDTSTLGEIELGIALGLETEHICIIGPKRLQTYHWLPNIQHFDSCSNFFARHFLQ